MPLNKELFQLSLRALLLHKGNVQALLPSLR